MTRKLTIITLAVLLLLAAGITAYVLTNNSSTPPNQSSSSPQNRKDPQAKKPQTGTPVTVTGMVICLTHKDTSGPQDLMCAIGLKSDDGTSYGLSSEDPSLTGSMPTGQRVKVTGTVTESQDTKYDMAGTLHVTSMEKL